jgi:hypothetical protein
MNRLSPGPVAGVEVEKMIRRSWPVLAAVLVVLTIAPASAQAARDHHVTRGLDYLHAQQEAATGAYATPTATLWVMLGAVATGERVGSSAWTHKSKNPMRATQAINQESAATASGNVPQYYAQAILGYVAAGRENFVYGAGTTQIDFLDKLLGFQDKGTTANPGTFSFSPAASNRGYKAVRTTAWAILAMHALSVDNDDFKKAVTWLQGQQTSDGGFGLDAGGSADTIDTALAIQALRAGGVSAGDAHITNALDYLDRVQLGNGGFPDQQSSSNVKSGDATSFAIQAIYATGGKLTDSRWQAASGGPLSALNRLQVKRGAFAAKPGILITPVNITGNALVALSHMDFAHYPLHRPSAVKAFVFRPAFKVVLPKGGTSFKTTHIVLIRATYGDGTGGTGINADAVRLFVDNVDKTKPAVIGRFGLHLTLKNVANGAHTYKITLKDHAGNVHEITRNFTIAVAVTPTSAPTPTTTPTVPAPFIPTPTPITPTHTPTPTPTETLISPTPNPYPSTPSSPYPTTTTSPTVTGPVVNSPSPGAGGGSSAGNGGGSAAGFLGGTLLAMLPLGAALSYYLLHRRSEAMAASVVGEKLAGGGSAWDKAKSAFAKSKDIVKPARS